MKRLALAALLLTASVARADVIPPPPPPPPGMPVATIAVGSAAGFGLMGVGIWLARRRRTATA